MATNRLEDRIRRITEYSEDYQTQVENLKNRLEEFKKKLDSEKNTYTSRFTETKQGMSRFLEEKINELDEIIAKLEKDGIKPYELGVKKIKKELDQSLDNVKSSMRNIKVETDDLQKRIESNIDAERNAIVSRFVQDLQEVLDEGVNIFEQAKISFEDKTKNLTTQNAQLITERVETQKTSVETLVSRVKTQLESFLNDGATLASNSEEKIKTTFERANMNIDTSLDSAITALNDDASSLHDTITKIVSDKQTALNTSLENLEKAIKGKFSAHQTTTKENLEGMKTELDEFVSKEGHEFDQLLDETKNTFLDANVMNRTKFDEEIKKVQDYSRSSIYNEINNVSQSFEQFHHAFTETIQQAIEALQRMSENLEKQLTDHIDSQLGKVQQLSTEFEKEIESAISNVQDHYSKEMERLKQLFDEKITKQGEIFKSNLKAFEGKLVVQLEKQSKEDINKVSEFKDEAIAETKSGTETSSKLLHDTRNKFKIMMDKFVDEQQQFFNRTKNQLSKELDTERNDIISNLNAIPEDMLVIVDRYKEEIVEKFEKTLADMSDSIVTAKEEINQSEADLLADIAGAYNDTKSKIVESRNNSKNKIQQAVDNNFDAQKAGFNEFTGNLNQTLASKASDLDEIKPSETLDPALTEFKTTMNKTISTSKSTLERIKEIRKELAGEDANAFVEEVESKLREFITDVERGTKDLTSKQKDVIKNIEKILDELKKE